MEKVDAVSATAGVLDTLPEPWARRGRWRGALGCSGGRAPETPVPKCRLFFLSAVALSCYKLFLDGSSLLWHSVPWESLNPLRGAPTAGNRGTAVLSAGLAAGRGIRPRCGASCPFGSLDRGVCGLVVGDDTPWCPRTASIPLGRLPSPAPPPLAVGGSMDCCCPSAAASLTLGDHSGPAPLRPVPPHYFGGCHAPTQVPLVTPRP